MESESLELSKKTSELLEAVRAKTPARILVGCAGDSYRTTTQLRLRQDHAAARDAVQTEFDVNRDFAADLVGRYGLFEVNSRASSKREFLMQPNLGRQLSPEAHELLVNRCSPESDIQVVIGDGLSATAVAVQVPALLPLLGQQTRARGWTFGQPFVVHYCRVGVLNDIGAVLKPTVVVLLIGERPGLATAESLSAYMAFRPRPGDTDAQRNLVSNIHARGLSVANAVPRILRLAETMRRLGLSGTQVKESIAIGEISNDD